MTSSTSPSEPRLPRWPLVLLAVALGTWAVAALYTLRWNPEIAFFRAGHDLKRAWAEELDAASPEPKVLVFGGSSCNTSIDARSLQVHHGLRVANLGLGAGMGPEVLARYALAHARPGDTVLASLEPELLLGDIAFEPMGRQFALSLGWSELLRDQGRIDWLAALLDLRPGGYHVITLFWKLVLRQPLYRYSPSEYAIGGWHAVAARRDVQGPAVRSPRLSPAARRWLAELRSTADQRGLRLLYAVPWGFCPADHLSEYRRDMARFLLDIAEILPVLKDPTLGADPRRGNFADTAWHPTPEAVAERMPDVAARLASLPVWSIDELRQTAAE